MPDAACHALVLEDDRPIAGLLKTMLAREGFAVKLVSAARDAIECIALDRYHLIVLDLMVPGHGQQVIDYIKQHHLDLLRSVIVVTAAPGAIRTALRGEYPEPICKFIAKPFDVPEFIQLVHACKELCAG